MQLWESIVLGFVQGFTEFLPVSSSGHLSLFSHILGVREPTIAFDILLHFGTLIAIFAVFWRDVRVLIAAGWRVVTNPTKIDELYREEQGVRLLLAIVAGTVPIVILSLLIKDTVDQLFQSQTFPGYMLLVTGVILFISDIFPKGRHKLGDISLMKGVVIGLGQALAIFPGISRSGTSITAGLLTGLDRESAGRFSFFLAIPAILGAMVLAMDDLLSGKVQTNAWIMLAGVIAAAASGYVAIKLLLQVLRRGRLAYFAVYTWIVGLIVIIFSRG